MRTSTARASGPVPANLDLFDMTEQDLIPECKGLMGAAAMLQNIMSDDYRVLTY